MQGLVAGGVFVFLLSAGPLLLLAQAARFSARVVGVALPFAAASGSFLWRVFRLRRGGRGPDPWMTRFQVPLEVFAAALLVALMTALVYAAAMFVVGLSRGAG